MQTVSFAGSSYNIPNTRGDRPWSGLSDFVIAAASKCINTAGGNFTLLADINFGASFGLVSTYYTSRTANAASAGQVRLANADTIKFRNTLNNANLSVAISSNRLTFEGSRLIIAGAAEIVNADVSASAAIAYTKLALTGSIVNADVNASAAIAYSKLNLSASVLNADIAAAAGIAVNKLAALTISRAVVTDASGFITQATTTAVEIGYVNGVTSAIQTQIDTKAADNAVVKLTGDQTIAGNKTFSDPIVQNDTTNQLVLGVTRTATISAPTPATSSRVYTFPDLVGDYSVVGTIGTQTISGTKTFSGQLIGKGTATNDDAAAGYIGEYIEATAGAVNYPSNGNFGDLASISLTAGDWDVTGMVASNLNGATATTVVMGISVTTGNSSTGLSAGINQANNAAPTSSATINCFCIPAYRKSLSGTATHYLKYYSDYTVGQIKTIGGRISARRVR